MSEYHFTIQQRIFARIISNEEKAILREIKRWERASGFDSIILMDGDKLLDVIKLGLAEYDKFHKEGK